MGLENLVKRPIGELSGGQLQRVLLGRSIVSDPQVLILDEPNSYVDKRFESHFYRLLDEINKKSAIVLVSHDIGTVLSMVKNIACVKSLIGGRCLFGTARHKQIGYCGHGYTHGYGTSDNGLFLFRTENGEKKEV